MAFDSIAELYDRVRPDYPPWLLERVIDTAGLRPGSRVLEIGCGSGQLTQQLVDAELTVTALDPGAALVELARRRVGDKVQFHVSTFEEFTVPGRSFELVVSASAFHWTDPDVRWTRTAALLVEHGALAIIDTKLDYDEPLASHIRRLWIEHSSDGGAWATNPPAPMVDQLRQSELFEEPITDARTSPVRLPPESVVALAQTSAAYLSYAPEQKESFTRQLTEVVSGSPDVPAQLGASLILARRR